MASRPPSGQVSCDSARAQTYNTHELKSITYRHMTNFPKSKAPHVIAIEVFVILLLLLLTRILFDQISWRYAGPLNLAFILAVITIYFRKRGIGFEAIGLTSISWPRGAAWFLPQTVLAFFLIGMTGAGVALTGEAFNLNIFTAEQPDPQLRWGNLYQNTPLYLSWLAILWFAGPAEELFFRGYLISRFREIFSKSIFGLSLSVCLPAIIFGLGHVYYQGWRGFFVTGAIGLTLGILFLLYRRNIWPLMVAHAAFNSMVFTALYTGAEF